MPPLSPRQQPSQPTPATVQDQSLEASRFQPVHKALTIAILLISSLLGLAGAHTALPQGDEAGYANPGYNLIYNGFSGVTVFHLPEYMPLSYGKHFLAAPPGYLFLIAAWSRFAGFSLFQVRLLSVLFSLVVLISWLTIARHLLNSPTVALIVMASVAVDYYFLIGMSHGRPEMVCIGCGTAAIATFLALRGTSPVCGFFLSHVLATLSILQHPAGLIYWLCLAFLVLYLDRRLVSLKTVAVAIVPCLLGVALWGAYILQDLPAFLEQWTASLKFNANVFEDPGLSNIAFIRNIQLEVVHRYLAPFGLLPGVNLVNRLKALVLVAYVVGVAGILMTGRLRRKKELRALPILAIISCSYLTLVVPGKFSYYLPHSTPFLAASLGAFLYYVCSAHNRKWVISGVLLVVGGIQLGGFLYLVRQNAYGRAYMPAVEAVQLYTAPHTLIVGAPELWFGVQPERSFVSDPTLGYQNGLVPSQFLFDPLYASLHQRDLRLNPRQYVYVQSLLDNAKSVYRNSQYQLFLPSVEVIRQAHQKAAALQ